MSSDKGPLFMDPGNVRYDGSCHCGKVKYVLAVEKPIDETMACNCTFCHTNGYRTIHPKANAITWGSGLDPNDTNSGLTGYSWGKGRLTHYFCKHCGTTIGALPVPELKEQFGNIMAVNTRTLKDVDLDALKTRHFDGRTLM